MPYSTSYAGLKADLLQNAEDYSADFMVNLDNIISVAETKVLIDLDLEIFQDEITGGALTAAQRAFSLPSGMVKVNALWLVVSGSRKFIEKRAKAYCEMYGEDPTVTERPTYWAYVNTTSLMFVNTPDQPYPVVLYGIVRPAGLSQQVPTTWLSTYAGQLLYTAARAEAEQYLNDLTASGGWAASYNNDLLPKAKIELRGMTRSSYEQARALAPATSVL